MVLGVEGIAVESGGVCSSFVEGTGCGFFGGGVTCPVFPAIVGGVIVRYVVGVIMWCEEGAWAGSKGGEAGTGGCGGGAGLFGTGGRLGGAGEGDGGVRWAGGWGRGTCLVCRVGM
jgi:hypothetical protein